MKVEDLTTYHMKKCITVMTGVSPFIRDCILNLLLYPNKSASTVQKVTSGKYWTHDPRSDEVVRALYRLGVDAVSQNVAPRGGAHGDEVKITDASSVAPVMDNMVSYVNKIIARIQGKMQPFIEHVIDDLNSLDATIYRHNTSISDDLKYIHIHYQVMIGTVEKHVDFTFQITNKRNSYYMSVATKKQWKELIDKQLNRLNES